MNKEQIDFPPDDIEVIPPRDTYIVEFEDTTKGANGGSEIWLRKMLKDALRRYGFRAKSVRKG